MKIKLTAIIMTSINCFASSFSIQGDLLYWTPRQGGTSYATSGASINNAPATSSGKVHRPTPSWNPGFRVGLDYILPHDQWDVRALYTRLFSSASDSANRLLISNWQFFSDTATITEAHASWSFHFNTIDLELGRSLLVSDYLEIRPFFGLKGTWQSQDYRASYQVGVAYGTHNTQDLWGVGLRGGAESFWRFCDTFGLFGTLAISGVWTQFDITRKDRYGQTVPANVRNQFGSALPVFECALGLKWQSPSRRLSFTGAFEEQLWLDMGQFIRRLNNGSQGSLSLMGLVLRAQVAF